MKKKFTVILGIIIILSLLGSFGSIFSKKSFAKELDNNSNFKYTTSLTSNYDHSDKAKVYSTTMSVEEAARYLIDQERPLEYTDLNNDDAIQLTYDDYYVLIYESEDGNTYIQISSRKYVHNNGYHGLYRPYRSNIGTFYTAHYLASRYYNRDVKRYGKSNVRPVKTVKTTTSNTNTNTKTDTKTDTKTSDSSKIKTDKNASTKIRTENQKASDKTTDTKSTTKSTTKTTTKPTTKSTQSSKSTTTTSSSSTQSNSIRMGSTGSKSRVGGGTSFGK
ncbi:hypothetical protein SH2C18_14090 [Clostridium sediminicola]|uniref:hypothetical protein n=1 Tax=Clostridium sediminicola TaxID=3114879 RepID=UPI0031F2355F